MAKEYIDREDAIEILTQKQRDICPMGRCGHGYVYGRDRDEYDAIEADIDAISNIPTADVRPVVRGHWIWKHRHRGGFKRVLGVDDYGNEHTVIIDDRYEIDDPYCSECRLLNDSSSLKFCPNCGADMRGKDNG